MTRKDFLSSKRWYENGDRYMRATAVSFFSENYVEMAGILKDYKRGLEDIPNDELIKQTTKYLQEEVDYMKRVLIENGEL